MNSVRNKFNKHNTTKEATELFGGHKTLQVQIKYVDRVKHRSFL